MNILNHIFVLEKERCKDRTVLLENSCQKNDSSNDSYQLSLNNYNDLHFYYIKYNFLTPQKKKDKVVKYSFIRFGQIQN